ncbi:hypothetical protein F5Y13DRAFT_171597 [Hypoxylon sp. FL1857]|nr:hypothetical protein F5Y13DRAFT_171597 [Hypoxylon sp. FL1857]
MDGKQARRSQLEISVHSKPPPYRPGDGPPLAPLRIVPEGDSTAFIVDKRVLPGTTANGELQLQMYYVVGWQDLPAARVSVLATKIHEYVSPRAVEDFEYKALLERDEELERQEAEKRRKAEEIAARKKKLKSTSATATPAMPSTPSGHGQKRRGRPSKAELQARQLSQQAGVGKSKSIEIALPSARTAGPSLSTPQKKRSGEIMTTDAEEIDEADPDDAIYRQLCGEDGEAAEDMDVDENEEGEDILAGNIPNTMSTGLEIRSYARSLWLNKDSTLFKRANGSLALKASTSHIPVPEVLRSNKQFPQPPPPPPPPVPPKPLGDQPQRTPIPVPPPLTSTTTLPTSKPSDGKYSTTPVPVPTPFGSKKEVPRPKPSEPTTKNELQSKVRPEASYKFSTTPIPVPSWPRPTGGKVEQTASIPTPQPPKASPEHHGFTPAARSSGKWPSTFSQSPNKSSQASPSGSQRNSTEHKSSSQSKRTPKSKQRAEEEKGQVWVVERLEGDRIVNVDGRHERYFKVRWEGNWPPNQNPSWEPEENLPPVLVKQYLKRKASRRSSTSLSKHDYDYTPGRSTSQHPLALKRKYSSVAEAFAGEDDLDELRDGADSKKETYANGRGNNDNYDGDDDEGDELLIVATEQETSPQARGRGHGRKPKLRPKPEDVGAAFMRDLAAAIHLTNEKGGQR